MKLKLIACKAITRELSYICALSDNAVDITWVRQSYHNYPDELRAILQKEIDAVEAGNDAHTNRMNDFEGDSGQPYDFDAILIGYGLCSNAITGLQARSHRLVVPKAHDCITLFLGSKERYSECFKQLPGCYWYTASWIDNTIMPGKERETVMRQFFEKQGYDEDMIDYLIETIGGGNVNYTDAAYISMPFYDREKYHEFTREAAEYYNWNYNEFNGDTSLLERFISGDWNEEDFLVVEPGETIVASYDTQVIRKKIIEG